MKIILYPIAVVKNERIIAEDDNWGPIISEIKLTDEIMEEAFIGIEAFSHLEIIFYMSQVKDEKAVAQIRHPRKIKLYQNWALMPSAIKTDLIKLGWQQLNCWKERANPFL